MDIYDILEDSSRVWVYQSARALTDQESDDLDKELSQFAERWTSHNRSLHAYGKVYHNRFIVLMVDESKAGASGCSIDSSVHFLQELQFRYNTDFFDRTTFHYVDKEGNLASTDIEGFKSSYENGLINENTLVFDTLVNTKQAFEQSWTKPLGKSWHKRFI